MFQQPTLSATAASKQPEPEKKSGGGRLARTAALGGLFLAGSGGAGGLLSGLGAEGGGGLAENAGAGLLQSQASNMINRPLAQNLFNMGVRNFDEVPQIANTTVGAVNGNLMKALDSFGHSVDMSGYNKVIQDLLDQDVNVSDPKRQRLLQIGSRLNLTPAGVSHVTGEANATSAIKELRTLEGMKAKAYTAWQGGMRRGAPDEEQHSIYNILRNVTQDLQGRIFSDEGGPLPFDDISKADMIKDLDPLKDSNPTIYQSLVDKIQSGNHLIEARHIMSDLVQASKAHEKKQYKEESKGTSVKDLVTGSPLTLPLAMYGMTGNMPDALSAGLMQSNSTNVGLTSLLSKLSKRE